MHYHCCLMATLLAPSSANIVNTLDHVVHNCRLLAWRRPGYRLQDHQACQPSKLQPILLRSGLV